MQKINGKINGELSVDKIKFSEIRTEVVAKNNKFSGKVGFPKEDIGKIVYILYPEVPNMKKTKGAKK